MTGSFELIECSTCRLMFRTDGSTQTCPKGHDNGWRDDDAAYAERLRGMVW